MALNYPGPLEVRLFYTTTSITSQPITHTMRLNCIPTPASVIEPGTPPEDIGLTLRNAALPAQLDVAVTDWVNILAPIFDADDTVFDFYEVWAYEPQSFDGTFITTANLGVPGTNSGAGVGTAAGQDIYVFRTQEGGIMKINLMESKSGVGASNGYSQLAGPTLALVDYVLSNNNWIVARDTSYPIAFKRRFPGQNEALFKRRYR